MDGFCKLMKSMVISRNAGPGAAGNRFLRPIGIALAGLSLLALAGCQEDGYLPRNSRHWVAMSSDMQSTISSMGLSTRSPILIRAYKKESELEVWKQNSSGEYQLLKTFPMCRWSGQLGPKKTEGDRQVPEGFYNITADLLNPNSSFYLSFNIGYPNAFDRAHGRTGSAIMVHGACSSRGCFSMTDRQIADIYALARESFAGGQKSIHMQSLPFRFTPENLAKYRADDNISFWKNLKEGADVFEVTKREPQVAVCGRRYVFNANSSNGARLDAGSACPPLQQDQAIASAVSAKNRADEQQVAALVSGGTRAVKRIYRDGDQHPSFKHTSFAQASGGSELAVTQSAAVPGSVSRVAEVSQPDALAAGAVEVPAEQARGLSRQQLLAKANQLQDPGLTTASIPAATAATPSRPQPRPAVAAATPVPPKTAATALVAAPSRKDEPAFYQRWLGGLGGLTASVSDVEASGAPEAVQAPLPPKAPKR